MVNKSLLCLAVTTLCFGVCFAAQAQTITVNVYPFFGLGIEGIALPGWQENFYVTEMGSTTRIYSSSGSQFMATFQLNVGQTYRYHCAQPSYYEYFRDLAIQNPYGNTEAFFYFPMVAVTSGVSIVNLNGPTRWDGAHVNFTFPHGVFSFDHASLLPTYGQNLRQVFGSGVPPAQFQMGDIARFETLPSGTYRVYSEAHDGSLPPYSVVTSDFTRVAGYYGIFAGEDGATGFKGSFSSANRSDSNWYLGDIVVSNPSAGCSRYEWAAVNAYNNAYGAFDETNHTVTSFLAEKCFDVSNPSALECVDVLFDNGVPQSTCGAFGDPHIIKFDRQGVTCGNQTYVTLVDNAYFHIGAHAALVASNSNATIFNSIVFTYKLPCNPITVTFTETDSVAVSSVNAPLAYRHQLRVVGNNIFIDALHLRFQARRLWSTAGLTFGLSIPTTLVSASTGVCVNSCPGYEENLSKKRGGLANRFASIAEAACDAVPSGTFAYDACIFDVGLTGNVDYADMANSFTDTMNEMDTDWQIPAAAPGWPEPTPDTASPQMHPPLSSPSEPPSVTPSAPSSTPSAGNPPTDQVPAGSASAVLPNLILLLAILATLLN